MAVTSYQQFKQALDSGISAQQILNEWAVEYRNKQVYATLDEQQLYRKLIGDILNQCASGFFSSQIPLYAEIIKNADNVAPLQVIGAAADIFALLKLSALLYSEEKNAYDKCMSVYANLLVKGAHAAEALLYILQIPAIAADPAKDADVAFITDIQTTVVTQLGKSGINLSKIQETIISNIIKMSEETPEERQAKLAICSDACNKVSALGQFLTLSSPKHEVAETDERLQSTLERLQNNADLITTLKQISQILNENLNVSFSANSEGIRAFPVVTEKLELLLNQTGIFNTDKISNSIIQQFRQEDNQLLIQVYINVLLDLKKSTIVGLHNRVADSLALLQKHNLSLYQLSQKHPAPIKAICQLLQYKIITGDAVKEFSAYRQPLLDYIHAIVADKNPSLTCLEKCDVLEAALNPYHPLGELLDLYKNHSADWKQFLNARIGHFAAERLWINHQAILAPGVWLNAILRHKPAPSFGVINSRSFINYFDLLGLENHPDDNIVKFWKKLPDNTGVEKAEKVALLVKFVELMDINDIKTMVAKDREFTSLYYRRPFVQSLEYIFSQINYLTPQQYSQLIVFTLAMLSVVKPEDRISIIDGLVRHNLLGVLEKLPSASPILHEVMELQIQYTEFWFGEHHTRKASLAFYVGRYWSLEKLQKLFSEKNPIFSIEKAEGIEMLSKLLAGLTWRKSNEVFVQFLNYLLGFNTYTKRYDSSRGWLCHTKNIIDIETITYHEEREVISPATKEKVKAVFPVVMQYPRATVGKYKAEYLLTIYNFIISLPKSTPEEIEVKYNFLIKASVIEEPLGYLFATTETITEKQMADLQQELHGLELAKLHALPSGCLHEINLKIKALLQLQSRIEGKSKYSAEITDLYKKLLTDSYTLLAFRNLDVFIAAGCAAKEQSLQLLVDSIVTLTDYLKAGNKIKEASKAIQDIWGEIPAKLYGAHIALSPLAESNLVEVEAKLEAYGYLRKLANRIDDIGPLKRIESETARLQRKQALYSGQASLSLFDYTKVSKVDLIDANTFAANASTMQDFYNCL
jgi:hypothetical protein